MIWIVRDLWLIPALPALAAGLSALVKQRNRKFAASLAIGSMGLSFLFSLFAFAHILSSSGKGQAAIQVFDFP
jgi:NADH-quinone oxidoreductase subunit L